MTASSVAVVVATNISIPGVAVVHQRQAWEDPAWPVNGPAATGVFDDFVGHYPGAGDVPDHDYRGHVYVDPKRFHNDLVGYYRQMQHSYAKPKSQGGRGYSIGYLLGIDYLGGLTVLRGFDFRNAANVGGKLEGNWNLTSGSAQFVTDLTEPATDQALYTFAMVVAWLRHLGHRAAVKRHDDGEWTSCPGAVGAQLSAGMGEPAYWVKHGPPPGCAPLPEYLAPRPPAPPVSPSYQRIAMASNYEFASATRWDTRGFGVQNPDLKAGMNPGEYTCKLAGSAGKVGATVNLTIVSGGTPGFAAAWKGGARPGTSKVNYGASGAVANEIQVPLAADGSFKIYISSRAHIIVDLVGYWYWTA